MVLTIITHQEIHQVVLAENSNVLAKMGKQTEAHLAIQYEIKQKRN